MPEHITFVETPTGTYELRHVTRESWVVWSQKHRCPVGVYESEQEASEKLNAIRMGEQLLDQPDRYETLEQIVDAAQALTFGFDQTPLSMPLLDRLLLAAEQADHIEEMRTLVLLAADCRKLEGHNA